MLSEETAWDRISTNILAAVVGSILWVGKALRRLFS